MSAARQVLVAVLVLGLLGTVARAEEDPPGTYAGKDAHWWIQQLHDRDGAIAAEAAFRKIGEPALEPLADALINGEPRLRRRLIGALKNMRISLTPVLDRLVAALETNDRDVQLGILDLVKMTGRDAVSYLDVIVPFVRSGDSSLADRALRILSGWGPEARTALPAVLELAAKGPPKQRWTALATAIAVAPDAPEIVPVLDALLQNATDAKRYKLIDMGSKLHPDVRGLGDLYARYARDPIAKVRAEVARHLAPVALADEAYLPVLIDLLQDEDAGVRRATAKSLQRVGTRGAAAVDALIALLENEIPPDDQAAILALAAMGKDAGRATPAILKTLERAFWTRELQSAAHAFFAGHPRAAVQALSSSRRQIRETAFGSVSQWSQVLWHEHIAEVGGAVADYLRGKGPFGYRQEHVLTTIAQVAHTDPRATRILLDMAHAENAKVRQDAARLAGSNSKNTEALIELMVSSDAAERTFAAAALQGAWRTDTDGSLKRALWQLARSEREEVWKAAGRLLVIQLGSVNPQALAPEDCRALARAAAALLDDEIARTYALSRLGQLGPYSEPYLDDIFALLSEDSLRSAAKYAAWALRGMGTRGSALKDRIRSRLEAVVTGEDRIAAAAAAHGLLHGDRDELLNEVLPPLMRDPRKTVHFHAVEAAGELRAAGRPLVPVLLEIARTPPPGSHVDQRAFAALGKVAPENEAFIRLSIERLVDGRRRDQRPSYEHALLTSGKHAVPFLAKALEPADRDGRLAILGVLGRMGHRAELAIDLVRPLVDDPDRRVAQTAKRTLEQITPPDLD